MDEATLAAIEAGIRDADAGQILFTNAALTDLEAILERSLTKHTATTPTYLGSLMVHIYQLRDFPFAGGESDRRTGTRALIHSP